MCFATKESSMLNKPVAAAAAAVALLSAAVAPARAEPVKNVVLVHGAFADGSGWQRVADILVKEGYTVSVVQEPLTSLADDVAATKRVLELQQGPTLLVGHSYGGVVITEAGNAPNVVGLVYIAAFIPDQGESAVGLLSQAPPPTRTCAPLKTISCTLTRPHSLPISQPTSRPPKQTSWPIPSRCWLRPPAARL
jgi:pimeloyl-ACP methyl ester carboxylesterase